MAKHSPEVIKAAESITCQTYGSPVRVATGLGDKTCEGVADIIHRAMSAPRNPDGASELDRLKNPHNTGTQPPASKQTPYQRAFYAKTQGMIGLNCGPACGCCEDCNSIWDHEGIEPPEEQPTDEGGIGSMPCDTCGCSLQGDRYVAHYWSGLKPDQELHHADICEICLIYIECGNHPNDWEGNDDDEPVAGTITIDGTTPEDYASRWGSTGPDGVYFYNYSSEIVEKTDEWLSSFIKVIDAQDREVRLRPDSYEPGDSLGLRVLRVCVYEQRKILRQQQHKPKTK